jgi:hypothetical protein
MAAALRRASRHGHGLTLSSVSREVLDEAID